MKTRVLADDEGRKAAPRSTTVASPFPRRTKVRWRPTAAVLRLSW